MKAPEIKRGSDDWRAAQAEILAKMGAKVSACHPFTPAMQLRDGTWRCGFMGDRERKERECRAFIVSGEPAPTPATPLDITDKRADAYEPQRQDLAEDAP